jgi:hypothetical protein
MARFVLLIGLFFFVSNVVTAQCLEGDCMNGEGKFQYHDKSTYEGQFVNRKAEGYGVCKYANGNIYKGEWENHTFNGKGILTYKNGIVYSGIWKNGKLQSRIAPEEIQLQVATRSIKPKGERFADEGKALKPGKGQVRIAAQQKLKAKKKVAENPIKIWALVVGVASYEHMPPLNYTDDDAYRMFAFLRSPEGGAVPDEQIHVLIDEGATRKNILSQMERLFYKADSNDVILFYFSGHGLQNSFLPIDFDGHLKQVKHDEIKAIFEKSPAKYKMCIADACHAGGMGKSKDINASSFYYKAFNEAKGGTAFMLSSKAKEISIENAGLRQGIFTHFLIKGMKGRADKNTDNIVTVQEVYDYVHYNVRFYTHNYQNPVLFGDYDKKMPVSVLKMVE